MDPSQLLALSWILDDHGFRREASEVRLVLSAVHERLGTFYKDSFIRHIKGKGYCVFSHQTGKNFGCYPKKAQAKKRLQQMHKFHGK